MPLTFHKRALAILCAPPYNRTEEQALRLTRWWIFEVLLAPRREDGSLIVSEGFVDPFEAERRRGIEMGLDLHHAWKRARQFMGE